MCKVWILEFGDFGFWILGILDFGIWILGILDFGFWRLLEFGGLGILDWQVVTKFWMLHKKRRLCTPNRVGGFFNRISTLKVHRKYLEGALDSHNLSAQEVYHEPWAIVDWTWLGWSCIAVGASQNHNKMWAGEFMSPQRDEERAHRGWCGRRNLQAKFGWIWIFKVTLS